MTIKTISVIIPIHDRFELADESIRSVQNQTYRPIELILVDDCSNKPFHPKVISDDGFKVILLRNSENKGPGASRETGRLSVHGDYIAYLDSDDLWHPDKLEKQVMMLQDNLEAGMCYCTSAEFNQLPLTGQEKIRKRSDKENKEFLPAILRGRPWDTSACLWTREATDKIGPWFPGWTWEDYEYDCRAGCLDIKICLLPDVLCYYRKGLDYKRLSDTVWKNRVLNQSASLIAMYRSLREFKKLEVATIRRIFLQKIYYQSIHLFYLDYKTIGAKFLEIIKEHSQGQLNFVIRLCLLMNYVLKSKTMADLLYWYRKKLINTPEENL